MSISESASENVAGFELPEELHAPIYAELRKLAAAHMNRQRGDQTLQPTGLVHEAWLRLARKGGKWRDQEHFFASASVIMRHILIDKARRKARLRREGLQRIGWMDVESLAAPDHSDAILMIDEGINVLESISPERAKIVVDRFFGGLTNREIAERLGIGERSVERHWALAKVWLLRWLHQDAQSRQGSLGESCEKASQQ